MSWDYKRVAEQLRVEGFRVILLVAGKARPDLGSDAGELRFKFPTSDDPVEQARLYDLVQKALFEARVRQTFQEALGGSEGESPEEQTRRELELARLRRWYENN